MMPQSVCTRDAAAVNYSLGKKFFIDTGMISTVQTPK